ncbi:ankyrin repeat-containing protein [Tanacetum coccineum]
MLPVSTEGMLQIFSDVSLVNTGRFFPGPNQTILTPLVHGNERGWVLGTDYRLRKLKMPFFNGDDVHGWVYLAERFFDIQGLVTSGERLKAAMMCLEGPALSWFRWSDNTEPFRSWEDLKRRMLVRFQSSQAGTLHEQFFAISQSGTAQDYITMFEKMAAQLPRLQEEVLEGIFIKGLKHELRTAVRTQKPTGLSQAMELALIIDETNKKAKGLCYRCDGKFLPGHRCPEKALQLLLVDDDEEEEKEGGMTRNTLHLEDKKEERVRLLAGSPRASTTPSYSLGSSTPLSDSPRPSRNAECSNCKFLIEKINVLEVTLEMYMHFENHTLDSTTLLHELYDDMEKFGLE